MDAQFFRSLMASTLLVAYAVMAQEIAAPQPGIQSSPANPTPATPTNSTQPTPVHSNTPFYNDDLPLNNARPFTPRLKSAFPNQTTVLKSGTPGSSNTYTLLNSRFSRYDRNFDGRLSPQEVQDDAGLSNRFKALDTNRDGYLSADEHAASASVPGKFVP